MGPLRARTAGAGGRDRRPPNTSHTNHRLRVQTLGNGERDLLLRRFTDAELLASNQAAADAFFEAWLALEPDLHTHQYWDVLDAVDWLGDGTAPGVTSEKLRRYETFVARALAELG